MENCTESMKKSIDLIDTAGMGIRSVVNPAKVQEVLSRNPSFFH